LTKEVVEDNQDALQQQRTTLQRLVFIYVRPQS